MESIHEIEARVADHAKLLVEHGRRITDVETVAGSHTQLINALQKNNELQAELAEIGRALVKVLGWVGAMARWVASIAALCAVTWGALKGLGAYLRSI